MESKYHMIHASDHDWFDYFTFNRNLEKEKDLYYNVLGLTDDSQYVFLNNMASVETLSLCSELCKPDITTR